jgi:hypothetical protein
LKNFERLKYLHIAAGLGLLAGLLFSLELWFPVSRTFPRVPFVFALPEVMVVPVERLLTAILAVALGLIIFSVRPKFFSATALAALALLIFFDQMRLQPWVYQYLLLLAILALPERKAGNEPAAADQTVAAVQLVIAGLYFWSGIQKLNFTFLHETLPLLLAPLQNLFPAFQPPALLGLGPALTESLIGIGLLVRKTRNWAVWLAVAMHAGILTLLIAKSHNSIVWVWNAALAAMVVSAFWKTDASILQLRRTSGRSVTLAKTIAVAAVLLPVLSFAGFWDMYLSGALYSGNTEVPVIRLNDALAGRLPPKAQGVVFQTKTTGERMLPLFEWSIAELNVPVYPEQRIFKQVARMLCGLTGDQTGVALIVKERPAIFDGSYKVTRTGCAELER